MFAFKMSEIKKVVHALILRRRTHNDWHRIAHESKLEQIRPKGQIDTATEEGRGEVHIALIIRGM